MPTSYRVFIIDDDPTVLKSLERLLQAQGYSVEVFGSARSFLESVPFDQQGVLLLDIHMPEMDGFELFERMREMHYRLSVIFMTGKPDADDRDTVMNKGALGFLQKPFGMESLLALIQSSKAHHTEEARHDR